MNIDFSNSAASSPNFTDLLYSQQGINIQKSFSQQLSPSIPTQLGETSKYAVPKPRWSIDEETALVSAWLNTSKDPIVGKEQKSGKLWDRVADYVAASPVVAHLPKREANTCKHKWSKINECVSKFVGCLECATRIPKSGLQDNDEMVIAYKLYYQDYKMKFTLEHVWRLLQFDEKWRSLYEEKSNQSTSAKRSRVEEDGTEERPIGVNAAKALAAKEKKKKKCKGNSEEIDGSSRMKMLEHVWLIKEKELASKERQSNRQILDSLILKTEPLTDVEDTLKNTLMVQMCNELRTSGS